MSNLDDLVVQLTIGNVRFQRTGHQGNEGAHGYLIEHRRPDDPDMRCTVGLSLCKACEGSRAHTLENAVPLTISPSLVCVVCGWHVFIRNGEIKVTSPATPSTPLSEARDFPLWNWVDGG